MKFVVVLLTRKSIRNSTFLQGSGYLYTSPEETSVSLLGSSVPVAYEAYADKSGNRNFFYPDGSEELVEARDDVRPRTNPNQTLTLSPNTNGSYSACTSECQKYQI